MLAIWQTESRRKYKLLRMPRYYFSLENGSHVSAGGGENFRDDQSARLAAEQSARELARNNKKLGSSRLVVRNAANKTVGEFLLKKMR